MSAGNEPAQRAFAGPDLSRKTAVVIGGLSGIGAATARRLAATGATVYATGRLIAENREQAPSDNANGGGSIRQVVADVRDRAGLRKLFVAIAAESGGIDIVVNSAGVHIGTPVLDTSSQDLDTLVAINLVGGINVILEAASIMGGRGGVIASVTSTQAILGERGSSVYAATKAGLGHYISTVVPEFAGKGIRMFALAVGATRTPMTAGSHSPTTAEGRKRIAAMDALSSGPYGHFFMEPDEIARSITFLVSDEARSIHGTTVTLDQGMTSAHRLPADGVPQN